MLASLRELYWANLKGCNAVIDILKDVVLGHGQEVVDGGDVVDGVGQDADLEVQSKL